MPQMAPTMWLPLSILVILLMLTTKSVIYFTGPSLPVNPLVATNYFNTNWPW